MPAPLMATTARATAAKLASTIASYAPRLLPAPHVSLTTSCCPAPALLSVQPAAPLSATNSAKHALQSAPLALVPLQTAQPAQSSISSTDIPAFRNAPFLSTATNLLINARMRFQQG